MKEKIVTRRNYKGRVRKEMMGSFEAPEALIDRLHKYCELSNKSQSEVKRAGLEMYLDYELLPIYEAKEVRDILENNKVRLNSQPVKVG